MTALSMVALIDGASQVVGLFLSTLGLLFLGPSSILSFIHSSLSLFITSMALLHFGTGVMANLQPVMLLMILDSQAGLKKKDVAGGLVGVSLLFARGSGLFSAVFASPMFDSRGIHVLSTCLIGVLLAICVPCIGVITCISPSKLL
jgi:hypothetical protein